MKLGSWADCSYHQLGATLKDNAEKSLQGSLVNIPCFEYDCPHDSINPLLNEGEQCDAEVRRMGIRHLVVG